MYRFSSRCIFGVHNRWKACVRICATIRNRRNNIHCL